MQLEIENKKYNIIIKKSHRTKNTYIKFDDQMNLIVSTNIFTSDKNIQRIIEKEYKSISKMYQYNIKKQAFNSKFFYLGKEYKIIYGNNKGLIFDGDFVYVNESTNIDKELIKLALNLFSSRLEYLYKNFVQDIPKPSGITIRKMKTRWGVCNTKTRRITLNMLLIKRNMLCIDYVIIHELSHLVEANHSKKFWKVVESNFPEYKKAIKMLKEY
ncbi:MAG: DUF45 domain-containing protein [bacterium]|nr:DUF45 domain-containing protein [bacterium]